MKLFKFFAEWCTPCKKQTEILSDFKDVPVVEFDVDEESEMANKFKIKSLPTMVLVDDEENEIHRFIGLTTIDKIKEYV